MKTKELRALSSDELTNKTKVLQKEIFELNYQRKMGRVEKPSRFKSVRREIAKILTILNERKEDGTRNTKSK